MQPTRLFDYLYVQKEKYPQKDCMNYNPDGTWQSYSTDETIDYVNRFSKSLIAVGVAKGDKVGIVGNNRPEWMFADFGIMQIGAVNVPLYPTISSEEYEYIINDADLHYIFVSSKEIYDKIAAVRDKLPQLKEVYTFDKVEGAKHWEEFLEIGSSVPDESVTDSMSKVDNMDLATIIYTSGTTGNPKGVMLSHNNILSNIEITTKEVCFDNNSRILSFLPLNHVFERNLIYHYVKMGSSIYFSEIDTIGQFLQEIKPHFFSCVPRLLEKVFEKIVAGGNAKGGIAKALFNWALNIGVTYDIHGNNSFGYKIQYAIAKKLVFSKIAEKLGGEVVGVVSGSAPLQPRLIRFFTAIGVEIMEGYGLTETSPIICVNKFDRAGRRIGTVGPKIDNVEVKIAEDGEILTRGPHVMMGYYKQPEKTAEDIDAEGWFHTGDIGIFVEDKFLKITDRKKQMFKTSGGKYICPQPIENKFKESRMIEQMMVVGEYQKFAGALIVPNFENVGAWAKEKGLSFTDNASLIALPEVIALIDSEKEIYNEHFGKVEKIKRFKLLDKEWTVEDKELTPTMKLKRKVVKEKYGYLIDEIYNC